MNSTGRRSDTKNSPPLTQPATGTYIVTSLEQAKVLVDPLRARILKEFVEAPRTTKQVADRLGEKPTRLYRHVEALANAGLLELKGERQKRGTIERYFQAVASRFEIGRSLFNETEGGSPPEGPEMLRLILQNAELDILAAVETGDEQDDLGPFVLRADIRAGEAEIQKLREKLLEWVDDCNAEDRGERNTKSDRHFAALVAFFPVERRRERDAQRATRESPNAAPRPKP